jgi:hypothetical protein
MSSKYSAFTKPFKQYKGISCYPIGYIRLLYPVFNTILGVRSGIQPSRIKMPAGYKILHMTAVSEEFFGMTKATVNDHDI